MSTRRGFALVAEWERGYTERFGVTYNDFKFGVDPQSPLSWAGQPTAMGQARTRKDSSRWLQEVWKTNAMVDPRQSFDRIDDSPLGRVAKEPGSSGRWAKRPAIALEYAASAVSWGHRPWDQEAT